jgi:hypothetical protein
MMVRYHSWCKNSLLLLKCKFVESRRHKILFYLLNSHFLVYLFALVRLVILHLMVLLSGY